MLNSNGLEAACESYDKEWLATELHSKATAAAITAYLAHAGEPARFPTAFCQPDGPDNSTAFSWPGSARSVKHTMALYAAPVASPLVGDDAGSPYPWKSIRQVPRTSIVNGSTMLLDAEGACIGLVTVLNADDSVRVDVARALDTAGDIAKTRRFITAARHGEEEANARAEAAEAALSAASIPAGVKVKALEWKEYHGVAALGPYRLFHAETPVGRFSYGTDAEGAAYWHRARGGVFMTGDEATAKRLAEAAWEKAAKDEAGKFVTFAAIEVIQS